MNGLDNKDYALLKALYEADQPLWKKRLHDYFEEHTDELPITDGVSLQTVGRRMDQLLADQYVDNVITDPGDAPRDMIIGYELTEKGQDAVDTYSAHLLRQEVKGQLFPEEDGDDIGKDALLQVMQDYFGFSQSVKDTLRQYGKDELVTFLVIRYAQRETVTVLDQGHLDEYRDILDQHPDVRTALDLQ
jgi:hypothetical protein